MSFLFKEDVEIEEFENKILLGIETKKNCINGIINIDFKCIDVINFGIHQYYGLLELRAKSTK